MKRLCSTEIVHEKTFFPLQPGGDPGPDLDILKGRRSLAGGGGRLRKCDEINARSNNFYINNNKFVLKLIPNVSFFCQVLSISSVRNFRLLSFLSLYLKLGLSCTKIPQIH